MGEIPTKECKWCKKDFTPLAWRWERSKYCSVSCKQKGWGFDNRGSGNPMFGKKFSEEYREKLRQAKLGRILPKRHRENIGKAHKGRKRSIEARVAMSRGMLGVPHFGARGANSPRWKGGVTRLNQQIRHSLEYQNWRRAVFARDDFTCTFCGLRGGQLNADHIKEFAYFPELRFEVSNGRTLCVPCHETTPSYRKNVYGKNQYTH